MHKVSRVKKQTWYSVMGKQKPSDDEGAGVSTLISACNYGQIRMQLQNRSRQLGCNRAI